MRKEMGVDDDAKWWRVLDLGTGKLVRMSFMGDDETGEIGIFARGLSDGLAFIDPEGRRQAKRVYLKGNIKMVPALREFT